MLRLSLPVGILLGRLLPIDLQSRNLDSGRPKVGIRRDRGGNRTKIIGTRGLLNDIRDDLRAYGGHWSAQGFWVMIVYRFGRWRYRVRPALVRKFFSLIYHILFKLVQIVTGIELPCEVEVGRNFVIDHFGGIVISGYTKFGDNCRIRNGVVVGLRRMDDIRAPDIGNNVDIGAGAKVLGPIRIGDNVRIGANAVVVCDVPANSIAVGVPAVVKPRHLDEEFGDSVVR
jgi:serine O-acetyltransferase